ncbi:MAG: class I SAM-dependent methyltransferase [Thermomicrobiales bacterium]
MATLSAEGGTRGATSGSRLPDRYHGNAFQPFDDFVARALRPGVRILDIGAGRRPMLGPDRRPPGCHYVGLDVSATELSLAPSGSYDETWAKDVTTHIPDLDGRFDLIVSWQVLEHVKPMETAIANIHRYLAPGGRFVALLSGSFAAFAILNRLIPDRLGKLLMKRLLHRDPKTVFTAHYDRCRNGALRQMLATWHATEIVPISIGAVYFGFSPPIQKLYLAYENWAVRGEHKNLATHYIITAGRAPAADHDAGPGAPRA